MKDDKMAGQTKDGIKKEWEIKIREVRKYVHIMNNYLINQNEKIN